MAGWPILSLTTFLPLVGAAFILLIRGEPDVVARNARNLALWTSLITFVLSLFIWLNFDNTTAAFQMVERADWIPAFKINYHMGVDGISVLFVLLSTFLTPLCILASWESIKVRVKEYMVAFLVLETLMLGMFCALDFVLFYVFFEGVLIPMFLIIGVWGGRRRVYAAFKFFLYTLLGSVLMLLAILAMYFVAGTTDIPTLMHTPSRAVADLAVARLLRLLRGEGPDVAGAYLAAGRARRGSDRRLGHPGRRAPEDGRLRLPPLLAPDASGGIGLFYAADVYPQCRSRSSTPRWWRWPRRT